MKKLLLLSLCLFAAIGMWADSFVESGDVSILKDASATFSVEISFTGSTIEGKAYKDYLATRDAEWNAEWPELQETGRLAFIKQWNKKNKKGMLAVQGKDAPYRMVIKPAMLDLGNTAVAYFVGFGAGGMKMSGSIELYKGSKKVIVIKVKDQTGTGTRESQRITSLFRELADDTWKDILKK